MLTVHVPKLLLRLIIDVRVAASIGVVFPCNVSAPYQTRVSNIGIVTRNSSTFLQFIGYKYTCWIHWLQRFQQVVELSSPVTFPYLYQTTVISAQSLRIISCSVCSFTHCIWCLLFYMYRESDQWTDKNNWKRSYLIDEGSAPTTVRRSRWNIELSSYCRIIRSNHIEVMPCARNCPTDLSDWLG